MTLKTTVTAPYDTEPFEGIEGDLSLTNLIYPVGVGCAALKLVDNVTAGERFLFTTAGSVEYFSEETETVAKDYSVLSNTKELKRATSSQSLSFLICVNKTGDVVVPSLTSLRNLYIPSISPRYAYDPTTKTWKFSEPLWGVAESGPYERPYWILKYTPRTSDVLGGGILIEFGKVCVWKSGRFAYIDVGLIESKDEQQFEVYKVTSQTVVNDQGPWEYPPGWPTDSSYPNGVTPAPEAGIGLVSERVHEICTITASGFYRTRTYTISVEKPYMPSHNYKPKLAFKEGNINAMPSSIRGKALELIRQRKAQSFPYGIMVF